MATLPGRAAYKRAIAALGEPNAEPLVMKHSPFAMALHARILSYDPATQKLRARFEPGEQFLQGSGVLQGGILATMMDFSMAFVTLAHLSEDLSCATAQLNIHYLKAANPGRYIAESGIEKAGRRLVFTWSRLMPEDGGDPVASSTAVF